MNSNNNEINQPAVDNKPGEEKLGFIILASKRAGRFLKSNWKSIIIFLIILGGLGTLFYYFKNKDLSSKPNYAEAYSLVRDSISQSANIIINLPPGIIKEGAQQKIVFNPKIEGKWVETEDKSKLIFDPQEKLEIGKYYTVTFNAPPGAISKDFLAAEDPEVVSIFPKSESEANEKSSITIIFNRPMVPLTTLDVLEEKQIPVEILPFTKGKFKWIGTRSLQFIPETQLIASANYQVKVKSSFTSMDRLNIKNFEHKFVTRKLRYNYLSEGKTIYNQPITINFNQPVSLEKTIKEISLENETLKNKIAFTAEYGTKKVYNKKRGEEENVRDEATVLIFNKKDKYGRAKFWNFNNNYKITIEKAYPKEGDINLEEHQERQIQVAEVIANINASSERTNFSMPEIFDPEGKLWIEFYEEINLKKSVIKADNLVSTGYGEKCKGDNEDSYYGDEVDCEKEEDKKKIYLTFDKTKLENSESISINFNAIKNFSGLKLNAVPITRNVVVYPKIKIITTVPGAKSSNASLTELYICSNTPLSPPAKEDINQIIKANLDYEFKSWGIPTFVFPNEAQYHKCAARQFETKIFYGLMPEKDYQLEINFIDDFNQKENLNLNFRTGKMPEMYLNFYHFQKNYNVTTPEKTRLTYAAENMDYVNMHICELSGEDMLFYLEKNPYYWEGPASVKNCINTVSKRIDLPKKYWIKNYFKVNLNDYLNNPRGHFLLTFSNSSYKERYEEGRQVYERTYLTITNLSVVEKKVEVENSKEYPQNNIRDKDIAKMDNLYWITNINRLNPVPNAKVELFVRGEGKDFSLVKKKTVYADNYGIAKTNAVDHLRGAVVTVPNDSAIISDDTSRFEYSNRALLAQKMYVYTDRPIYRPGDEVHIKGLHRIGYDGVYEIFREKKVPLKIFDSQDKEIFNQEIEINDFGTFNANFTIDMKAPLGRYRIEAFDYGYAYFDVEEYTPAAFKVETKVDKEEYIASDTFNMNIDANYYFGAPVEGGDVEYSIATQNYYFDKYKGDYFRFGSDWYYCYFDCDYGDKFISRNKIPLNGNGKANFSYKMDFNKLFKEEERQSKIFVVYVTVKNKNGQSVSAQKSFVVHSGEFYLGLMSDKSFLGKKEHFQMKLKSVDTQGREIEMKNIKFSLNKVKWVNSKRKEVDGAYYYHWERKLEKIESRAIATNEKGDWDSTLSIGEEGEYEIMAKAQDKRGNEVKGSYNVYVWGEGYVDIMPSNNEKLEVITDNSAVEVGGKANIIIKSPYEKAKALISIERGKIFEYKIVDVNQSLYKYSFKIQEEYIPNIYASVVLLSGKPEVKFGKVQFNVNTKEKELNINVKSNKEYYLPGEEVVLNFETKNSKGNPVEAEFSAAVADLSVLALKGNPKKNPLVFFYEGFPLTVSTVSNVKNILYEVDVPAGTKGGGGAEPSDLAKKKRGIFKDTAFWQAVIRTNKDGKAEVKFRLPDNLTTWQVESLGITKDTKLGADYSEFIARKDLMVIPLKPRFIIPGDEFLIGAKIFNQTKDAQSLGVNFSSGTLILNDDDKVKNIKIGAGETQTIYFKIAAPLNQEEGSHTFILSAKNEKYEDTVEQALKVRRNDTYETTAAANYSSKNVENEYIYIPSNVIKEKGELTVNYSATLAVFLSDALQYLFEYPYGCSEQVASKLEAIAVVKKGLGLENLSDKFKIKDIEFEGEKYSVDKVVELGLMRLYENQKSDGGFAYYKRGQSNIYLTLHIIGVLKDLKDAGFNVNTDSIKRAIGFINYELKYEPRLEEDNDLMITAGYTLSNLKNYGAIDNIVINRINKILNDEKFLNEEVSNNSLSYLAILLSREEKIFGKSPKDKVFKILENRIEIDSRGAFLPSGKNIVWQYYETPIKNSSLLLKALTQNKRDNQILDRILRWILNSRKKDGAWGSTNNTISVIDALTDYLKWQKETESNFTLKTFLNDNEKSSFTYDANTILTQNRFIVPINELGLNTFNKLSFNKTNHNDLKNSFYYDMSLKYYLPIDSIPPRDEGFTITREFYHLDDKNYEHPVQEAKVGEVLKGHIEIVVPKSRNFVAIEDFIPAGVEIVNFNLTTEDQSLIKEQDNSQTSDWDLYDETLFVPDAQEVRDDRLFSFKEYLSPNTYHFDYYVRVLIPGKFHHLPAVVSEMYTPENFGRTRGDYFKVNTN